MTAFTRLGSGLWDWEPWTDLPSIARLLWLALYTSGEAKRHVPGLWQGGIPSMADAARMPPDDVITALDLLLERDLVEYDPKPRVLRLCVLPDPGEYPSNGKVIRSWWTRFKTVSVCQVRDAHIRTLRWILDTGAAHAGGAVSANHETSWQETFGTVAIPAPRRRGVRRLADSDTSTHQQPSLFPPSQPLLASGNMPPPMQYPIPSYPQGSVNPQVEAGSVDNSASLRQLNEINTPETVSDTVSDTNRIPDPGSRIPEFSSSSEGGLGGGYGTSMRPHLVLVPPFSAKEVLTVFQEESSGQWDPAHDRTHQDALSALIPLWVAQGVGLGDLRVLAQYNAHAQRSWSARALVGCDITSEIDVARRTLDWRDAQLLALRERVP